MDQERKQKVGNNRRAKMIRATKLILTTTLIVGSFIMLREVAHGAGTAVQLDFMDNLGATVIDAMKGAGSLVIDAIIIAGGGFASARASSPTPIFFALGSAGLFELFVKLLIK